MTGLRNSTITDPIPVNTVTWRRTPNTEEVRARLAAYLPEKNAVPESIQEGGSDSFGRRVEGLLAEGVPGWLGEDPAQPTAK